MRYLLLNLKFWLLGNIKKYFPSLSNHIRNTTSVISINHKNKTVKKETIKYLNYNIVDNEVYWLTQLNNFTHTPNIISHNKNKLILSYAGEPLNFDNLPEDWKIQVNTLLNKLNEINCSHNDIKPTDLLVLNGKIMLIDFQWATKLNESIPDDWPDYIGGTYKSKDGFNDKYSIYKSIDFISRSK